MKRKLIRGSHTAGTGAKKKHRGKGHKGGKGKSGSGKRADQKKTKYIVGKQKGKKAYFGSHGFTSRKKIKTQKKLKTINLRDINEKFAGKKEIELKGYKILGEGEINKKITIKADFASKSVIEKVKGAGGDIILKKKRIKKKSSNDESKKSDEQGATDNGVKNEDKINDIKKIKPEEKIENKKEENK